MIRFECLHRVESEQAAYINMLDYFMEKHRYGVFQTGFGGGVKDMYLIPLSYDDPVPLPIQPFSGPGNIHTHHSKHHCVLFIYYGLVVA